MEDLRKAYSGAVSVSRQQKLVPGRTLLECADGGFQPPSGRCRGRCSDAGDERAASDAMHAPDVLLVPPTPIGGLAAGLTAHG